MSKYVYMLSTYGEYGSEDCVCTLDRSRIKDMLAAKFPEWKLQPDENLSLEKIVSMNDDDLAKKCGHDITCGWGGIQLHVIPVFE